MKIVQVIPSLEKGGAERLVIGISEALMKRGHDVTILMFNRNSIKYPVPVGITIVYCHSYRTLRFIQKDEIDNEEYRQCIEKIAPDIIHAHLIESELLVKTHIFSGVRYIFHLHGYYEQFKKVCLKDLFHPKELLGKMRLHHVLSDGINNNDAYVIAISESIRNFLLSNIRIKPSKVKTITNFIDPILFRTNAEIKKMPGFNLVTLGSLSVVKNQAYLLNVMKFIVDECHIHDIKLNIIGDGVLRDSLTKFIKENNLSDYVEMHGQQDNPQVILNKCHLYVHSAIREGFGLAPLEAAACGLPTVCLSAGGISEVVQHNVTGCILPQNTSSSAFASKIIELYRDADLLKSLSENAVRVSKTFDIDTSIDKIIQLYTA